MAPLQETKVVRSQAVFTAEPIVKVKSSVEVNNKNDKVLVNIEEIKNAMVENENVLVNTDNLITSSVDISNTPPKTRLSAPKRAGSCEAINWLYSVTPDGALSEGNNQNVVVSDNCAVLIASESNTRVCSTPEGEETQFNYTYKIGQDALLAVLRDATVLCKGSNYVQTQTVHMANSASLILLDWFTGGVKDEQWELNSFSTINEVFVDGEMFVQEGAYLSANDPSQLTVKQKMGKYEVYGMLVLMGHRLEGIISLLNRKYGDRTDFDDKDQGDVLVACSPLDCAFYDECIPGCRINFMCTSTVKAYGLLEEILGPVVPCLGGNPFESSMD